jgi:AraC family transcriptional regulator, regulatory protein of adaptative response / methylated-DNA-[protein]-cysteine methyltransferase
MIIRFQHFQTPLGTMYGGATDTGVCFVEFIDRIHLDKELTRLGRDLNASLAPGEHPHLFTLEKELIEYFGQTRKEFTVPLHLTGTPFQRSVWQTLLEIPYGDTWSYKQQALRMNQLPAIRAVAAANGQNKHAIVIPCHRVVGSNGHLTGYAAGLAKKKWLLEFEKDKTGQTLEMDFGQ